MAAIFTAAISCDKPLVNSVTKGLSHDVEVEKNGSGSKLYITYSSASAERLSGSGVQKLMKEIHSVAIGE